MSSVIGFLSALATRDFARRSPHVKRRRGAILRPGQGRRGPCQPRRDPKTARREAAPDHDPSGPTSFLAAQLLLGLLGYMFHEGEAG
jgi:hypothetical protein